MSKITKSCQDTHFTDTVFYQIELTAKYCKMLGNQIFKKFEIDLPLEEFSILDSFPDGQEVCQRDLAKLILRDRANTGKLLDSLEKKGYIKRTLKIKNNRPVKIVEMTEAGIEKRKQIVDTISPHFEGVKQRIHNSDLIRIKDLLKELREVLNEAIDIQI